MSDLYQLIGASALQFASITDLTLDSREVQPGSLFIALPGENYDGRDFVRQAFKKGAIAAIVEEEGLAPTSDNRVVPIRGLRNQLGDFASQFFGNPSETMKVIAVTGTNGKTSVTDFCAQLLRMTGKATGSIGTLGIRMDQKVLTVRNTTPDPITLHRQLKTWRAAGVEHVVMEASSHGLNQKRMDGLCVEVAAFTCFSRDHLDYHGSMKAYFDAKLSLVTDFSPRNLVYNADDPMIRRVSEYASGSVLGISNQKSDADIFYEILSESPVSVRIKSPWGKGEVCTNLFGSFNAFNLVASIASVVCTGLDFCKVIDVASSLEPVAGRFQYLDGESDISVFIDYAHTPDALQQCISALTQEKGSGKLWVIFGCGGNRDKGKRPEMGAIASGLADRVVLTNDNPRHESPEGIVQDILSGCKDTSPEIKLNREDAIEFTLTEADTGDVVLIAGKGHEVYQEVAGELNPFSDFEFACKALQKRRLA